MNETTDFNVWKENIKKSGINLNYMSNITNGDIPEKTKKKMMDSIEKILNDPLKDNEIIELQEAYKYEYAYEYIFSPKNRYLQYVYEYERKTYGTIKFKDNVNKYVYIPQEIKSNTGGKTRNMCTKKMTRKRKRKISRKSKKCKTP